MDKFVKKRSQPSDAGKLEEPPTKKTKPFTKLNANHMKEFPFIRKSNKGDTFGFCSVCNVDISVRSGGKDDIKKHTSGQKHQNALKESKATQSVSSFFAKSDNMNTIRAEVLWTQFIIQKSLPFRISGDFGKVLKKMCPDSEIAKKFSCGKTKTKSIAKCIGEEVTSELVQKMKVFPFGLGTDGSSDNHNKLYPIVVTIYDEGREKVVTELLSVPALEDSSNAVNITKLMLDELQRYNIPLNHCMSFMSDNANVMVGAKGGVSTLLRKEQPNLISLGCGCHLINLSVKRAISMLPVKVDELLTDVYYFFHHSEKRVVDFNKVQMLYNDETKKILKHCPTRWLCLTTSLTRLVDLWQSLLDYLKRQKSEEDAVKKKKESTKKAQDVSEQVVNQMFSKPGASGIAQSSQHNNNSQSQSSRLDRLVSTLKSKKALTYCSFLLWIMPVFDRFNKSLQNEEPQIHKLNNVYLALFREVLSKFIKPKVINAKSSDLTSLDFESEAYHIQDKDLYIGEIAAGFLGDMKAQSRSEIISNIKLFYIAALKYMKDNFPLNTDTIVHAKFMDIQKRAEHSFSDVLYFYKKMPASLKCSMDELHSEFTNFQSAPLSASVMEEPRCDRQWHQLYHYKCPLDGSRPYQNLGLLALSVLSIPHSNAAAERIFSLVRKTRTESRPQMSNATLNTLLVNKVRVSSSNMPPVQLTDKFLQKCKRATKDDLDSEEEI